MTRNLILLTPVTIGLQKGSNSRKPFSSQQQGPSVDQRLNKDQLIQGPNPSSPKTPFNPQHPSDTDHSDLSSHNPQNQNPVTTTSKKPQLRKKRAELPKISPENLSAKLKRKSSGSELDQLAKRLKNAVTGSKQVYFDPISASFIPCSRLESFILK